VTAPTLRANKFPGRCHLCKVWVPERAGMILKRSSGAGYDVFHLNADDCERAATREAARAAMAAENPASAAEKLSGLDLSHVPSGKYAVPGGDTRLKVLIANYVLDDSKKWAGWIFVSDAAVYGRSGKYGSQRPDQHYTGKITAELEAIAKNPEAAAAAYGHLTSKCGFCGRPLEVKESVERGIGPDCWKMYFGGD
jgi:hypothetical protein